MIKLKLKRLKQQNMKFRESILHFRLNKVIKKRQETKITATTISQQSSGQFFIDSHLNQDS